METHLEEKDFYVLYLYYFVNIEVLAQRKCFIFVGLLLFNKRTCGCKSRGLWGGKVSFSLQISVIQINSVLYIDTDCQLTVEINSILPHAVTRLGCLFKIHTQEERGVDHIVYHILLCFLQRSTVVFWQAS